MGELSKCQQFKIGDKVAYTVQFLRSIYELHSNLFHARGTVIKLIPFGRGRNLVEVNWEDPEIPEKVLDVNLCKVGANTKFCNCD